MLIIAHCAYFNLGEATRKFVFYAYFMIDTQRLKLRSRILKILKIMNQSALDCLLKYLAVLRFLSPFVGVFYVEATR